jgi:hypothetical protein
VKSEKVPMQDSGEKLNNLVESSVALHYLNQVLDEFKLEWLSVVQNVKGSSVRIKGSSVFQLAIEGRAAKRSFGESMRL